MFLETCVNHASSTTVQPGGNCHPRERLPDQSRVLNLHSHGLRENCLAQTSRSWCHSRISINIYIYILKKITNAMSIRCISQSITDLITNMWIFAYTSRCSLMMHHSAMNQEINGIYSIDGNHRAIFSTRGIPEVARGPNIATRWAPSYTWSYNPYIQ